MLTRSVAALATMAILLALAAAPAHAGDGAPTCHKYDDKGICLIWVHGGGHGGGSGGGSNGWSPGSGHGVATSGPVVLTIDGQHCVLKGASDPQPPLSDPVWKGHTHGAVYDCEIAPQVRMGSVIAGMLLKFWAVTPPGTATPLDPRVLAQKAIASMQLKAVTVGIVPESRAGSVGIIGMPTWMWVEDPGPTTWGPITRAASAAGFTVTATARVTKVVWSMGDGTSVTCTTAGTAYQDAYRKESSPDCGHTYTRQGRYAVFATNYWTVNWVGIGQRGTIPLNFSRSVNITMGEAQVLSK